MSSNLIFESAPRKELAANLESAIAILSRNYRVVFTLHDIAHLDVSDVAAVLRRLSGKSAEDGCGQMNAAALNSTPESELCPAPRRLPVSRSILYATLTAGVLDATDGVVYRGLHGQHPNPGVALHREQSAGGPLSFSGGL